MSELEIAWGWVNLAKVTVPEQQAEMILHGLDRILAHLEAQEQAVTPSLKNHRHLVKPDEWADAVWTTAEVTGLTAEPLPETPPSGATLIESSNVSQTATTPSTPATDTGAPTSLTSELGRQLADPDYPRTQAPPSRTTAPTSFIRGAEAAPGPSASIARHVSLREYLRHPAAIVPALIPDNELGRFDRQWVSLHDYNELLACFNIANPAPGALSHEH